MRSYRPVFFVPVAVRISAVPSSWLFGFLPAPIIFFGRKVFRT